MAEVKPWMETAEANIRETWDSATDYDGRISDIIAAHAPDGETVAALVEALKEAAQSLGTIRDQAGGDELEIMLQVKGYANSRAIAARAALQKAGVK